MDAERPTEVELRAEGNQVPLGPGNECRMADREEHHLPLTERKEKKDMNNRKG